MNEENILHSVLERYALAEAKTQLLGSLWNHVYYVEAENGQQYSLRLCSTAFQEKRWLEDELVWLDFVASRRQVRVPRPVRNRQGDLLTIVSTPAGDRLSCLFEWVEGQPARQCLTIPVMRRIGRAVATLHQLAREFAFPSRNNHFRHDYRYDSTLVESHRDWIDVHQEEIGAENVTLLYTAIERLLEALARIGETPDNFGFIHADLHFGNFLVQNGRVSVIDFDQLGRGHYLYDMAVLLVELLNEPEQFPARWQSFIAGYQTVTALPFRQESELDPFIVAVNLAFLDWVYNTPNPAVREEKMRWVPATYESIQNRL